MQLTRAFRHAGRIPAILLAATTLMLATSCAHVRAQPAPLANTTGEQKALLILLNFADKAEQPQTREQLHQLVFGQVSDFYWEASYQKTFFSGDTIGWVTIPVLAAQCSWDKIVSEGNRAAAAAGADVSQFQHFIYMYPAASGCVGGGGAQIGPQGEKRVFINGASGFTMRPVAHEIGHTFGLSHADALDCGASVVGDNCTRLGYGDGSDGMGGQGHFNAFHKEKLGWLNVAGAPPITSVSASGRFRIAAYETNGSDSKGLKILKSVDPATGRKTWYYVEYRQPIGFDAWLAQMGNLTKGVQIRAAYDHAGVSDSLLLDMTPGSQYYDFDDAALAVGRSYSDAAAGVTISLVSADTTGATVDVTVAAAPTPTCTRAAPTLSLVGPGAAVAAGSNVNYTLSVSNRDSSACTATTFNLARSIPSGWTGTLAASTINLSPGASGSTTLTVTSPASASAGGYAIGAGASSSVGSAHTANASTTYSVASGPSSGTLTETVGTDKTSYLRGQTVYMSALVKNNGVAVNGATVKFNVTLSNGSVAVLTATSGSDGYARSTYSVGKGKGAIGQYALRADATSGGSSASANASFSVN